VDRRKGGSIGSRLVLQFYGEPNTGFDAERGAPHQAWQGSGDESRARPALVAQTARDRAT
jgi:hypothetical protein